MLRHIFTSMIMALTLVYGFILDAMMGVGMFYGVMPPLARYWEYGALVALAIGTFLYLVTLIRHPKPEWMLSRAFDLASFMVVILLATGLPFDQHFGIASLRDFYSFESRSQFLPLLALVALRIVTRIPPLRAKPNAKDSES